MGGDTVAFQQFTTGSNSVSAICVASLSSPLDPALCLTDETRSNSSPDVSPDGNTVVFQQCVSPDTACDIFAARRNPDGTWSAPVAITVGGGNDLSPATNGTIVVYSSDAEIAAIQREATLRAGAALETAIVEIRQAIGLIRAEDDPQLASLQTRQGTAITAALQNVEEELTRAVGL